VDQSQDQELGIFVIQNRLRGMELREKWDHRVDSFIHPFNSGVKHKSCIYIHILRHRGYQRVTTEWGIVTLNSIQLHQECSK